MSRRMMNQLSKQTRKLTKQTQIHFSFAVVFTISVSIEKDFDEFNSLCHGQLCSAAIARDFMQENALGKWLQTR